MSFYAKKKTVILQVNFCESDIKFRHLIPKMTLNVQCANSGPPKCQIFEGDDVGIICPSVCNRVNLSFGENPHVPNSTLESQRDNLSAKKCLGRIQNIGICRCLNSIQSLYYRPINAHF